MRLRLFCHIIFFLLLAFLPVSAHAQCDSRFETFAAAVRTVSELKPNRQNATEYSVQAYWKARERVSTFGISTSYEGDVAVDHRMNESKGCSDSRNCEDYVKWYVDYIFRGNNKTDGGPDGSAFYKGRNDLQYKSVLSSIEKWGLALAPFDLDFITDAIGTVYALSNGDYEEGIINLSCIFIPASIDKAAKSAIIGLRAGTHELVSEGGKYLIKKVDLLGLITTKIDTKLVKEFESDFAGAGEEVLRRFVEKPELVDGWQILRKNNVSKALRTDIDALENLRIETFVKTSWNKQGFESKLDDYLKKYDISKKEFEELYKHPYKGVIGYTIEGHSAFKEGWLVDADFKKLIKIRNDIYVDNIPNNTTIFQKVICPEGGIENWVKDANSRGNHVSLVGSTLIAKDGAHLNTPAKLYDGLQLNYRSPSNNYSKNKSMYVVRYTTDDAVKAKIPVKDLDAVPENMRKNFVAKPDNKYPFTGNGFTPSLDGNLGTPELNIDGVQVIKDAVIVRIDVDGTETIVGYTLRNVDLGINHFILKE